MGAEPQAQAEVAVRGRLGGLRLARDDERMPRVDRDDERADSQAGDGGADQAGQGDGVVVETLGQPDLADADLGGPAGLGDDVVDDVGGGRAGLRTTPVDMTGTTGPDWLGIPFRSACAYCGAVPILGRP